MPNPRRRRIRFVLKQALSAVGIDPATLYRESGATIDAVIKAIPVARPAEARGQSGDMAFLQGGGLRTLAGGVNINGAGIFASGEADFTDVDPATYAHYYFGSPTTKLSPNENVLVGQALDNGWGDLGAGGPGGHAALYTPNGPVQPYVATYGSAIGFPYSDLCKGGVAACTASQTATFYIGGFFSLPTGLTGGLGHTFLNTSGSGRMFLNEDNCMYDLIETRTWTTGNVPRTILIFTGTLAPLNADNVYDVELRYFDSFSNSHKFVYTAGTSSLYTGISGDGLTSSYTFFSGTTAQDAALNFAKVIEASIGNDAATALPLPQNKASWQMTKVYVSGSSDWQFGPLGAPFADASFSYTPENCAVVEIYDGDQNPLNKSTIGRRRLATVTVTGSAPKLFNGASSNSAIWSISASYASVEEFSGIPATSSPTEFSCSLPGFGDNGLSCTAAVMGGDGIYTTAYQWAGSGSMGSDYFDCVRTDTLTGSVPSNAIVAMQYVLDVSASSLVTAEAMAAATTEIIPGACVWITGSATTGSGLFERNMQLKSCIDV